MFRVYKFMIKMRISVKEKQWAIAGTGKAGRDSVSVVSFKLAQPQMPFSFLSRIISYAGIGLQVQWRAFHVWIYKKEMAEKTCTQKCVFIHWNLNFEWMNLNFEWMTNLCCKHSFLSFSYRQISSINKSGNRVLLLVRLEFKFCTLRSKLSPYPSKVITII
jgi:hypothetical protein